MFKKISKIILKSILWILAFVVFVVLVGYLTASYWITPLFNKYVPEITKTPASISSVDLSLLSGRVALNGLNIGNPEGFPKGDLFKLNQFSVKFQPKSILTDKIIVDQVLLDGIQISAELNTNGQINLMTLNQNVQTYLNGSAQTSTKTVKPVATKQEKTASKNQKAVIIKDLQILNTSVQMGFMGKRSTIKLPDFTEKNIGEKNKTSMKDAIMLIVNKLTVQPIEELTKAGQKALENTLKRLSNKQGNSEAFQVIGNSLSKLFK